MGRVCLPIWCEASEPRDVQHFSSQALLWLMLHLCYCKIKKQHPLYVMLTVLAWCWICSLSVLLLVSFVKSVSNSSQYVPLLFMFVTFCGEDKSHNIAIQTSSKPRGKQSVESAWSYFCYFCPSCVLSFFVLLMLWYGVVGWRTVCLRDDWKSPL